MTKVFSLETVKIVYISESIQKPNALTQTSSERDQITRIEKSGDKDVQKIVLADQEINLSNVATIIKGILLWIHGG